MLEVFEVRARAIDEGRDTFKVVSEWLNGLSDEKLDNLLAKFESRKTYRQRMKTREIKVRFITSRVCQGDAFRFRG